MPSSKTSLSEEASEFLNSENQKSLIKTLLSSIVRCYSCKSFNYPYCKRDCIDTVVKYYNDNDKVYNLYRMTNLALTLYYIGQNEQDLKDKLLELMLKRVIF